MTLAAVLNSVRATVRWHESTFQRVRAVVPVLVVHATATELLDAMSIDAPSSHRERQDLVLAVVMLHRTAPHPLWHALLLHTFRHLLWGLRKRDHGPIEDRDERVLLSFLQALGRVPLEGQPVFLAMRRATERILFRAVRAQTDGLEIVSLDSGELDCARMHEDPDPFTACLARELLSCLDAKSEGVDVANLLTGFETVGEQAERLASVRPADAPGVSLAALRKRRSRAVAALRAHLKERA
ncbi:MAG TPA: hypothetical protein VIJ22_02175 [Polyangiaceae bacterium]